MSGTLLEPASEQAEYCTLPASCRRADQTSWDQPVRFLKRPELIRETHTQASLKRNDLVEVLTLYYDAWFWFRMA